jgi:hypothetical protein
MGRYRVTGQGHQIFLDELTRFAAAADEPRVAAISRRFAAPRRVAVFGRPGVGRGTVARALALAGVSVAAAGRAADVDVHVVAEVIKPEDRAALAASGDRALLVLNKADLAGFGTAGPMPAAQARCDRFAGLTRAPAEPLVALLAVAALDTAFDDYFDGEVMAALRLLVTEPADLGSTDGFVTCPHRLSRDIRVRLLDTLDLFGIAHAVLAVRRAADADAVRAVLRRVSRVDAVVARITALGAAARHQRVCDAVTELEALAITAGDARLSERITAFLVGDDAVIGRMAAAVEVVEAAGLTVDPADDAAAHLRRTEQWQRYGRGPVSAVHRACGSDIARGSLRLWMRAGGSP